jgi:hypothetical protein
MAENLRLILVNAEGEHVEGVELIVAQPLERLRALPLEPEEVEGFAFEDWDERGETRTVDAPSTAGVPIAEPNPSAEAASALDAWPVRWCY